MRMTKLGLLLPLLVLPAGLAAESGAETEFVPAGRLRQDLSVLHDGLAVVRLPAQSAGTTLLARRDRDGEVEVHRFNGDQIIAREGRAIVLIGTSAVGGRTVSEGELRGGEMIGARPFPLAPDDVLWIPPGVPHRIMVPPHGLFTYITVKVPDLTRMTAAR